MSVALTIAAAITHLPATPNQCSADTLLAVAPTRALAVPGYSADQLANATAIIHTAAGLRLGRAAAVLGVMAAMAESGLRELPYGDNAINPDGSIADSIGLFQQQHPWGSRTERMDPTTAATRFYQHLEQVPHWQALTPTAAAHAVQGNADPDYYTAYYPPALSLVDQLTNTTPCPTTSGTGPAFPPAPSVPALPDVLSSIDATFLAALAATGATLPDEPADR